MADRPPPRPPPRPNTGSHAGTVLGLLAFVGLMGVVPLLLQRRHMRLQSGVPLAQTERPLAPAEVRRGAYLNTGSKDAGPDPDWDLKANTYKGQKPRIIDADNPLTRANPR